MAGPAHIPLTDRVLMGPGPCNPYPEVALAMARPMLGHLDPEFIELLDDTNARLREVFRTANQLTFPISATGSAGMEAAFVNVIEQGDVAVVGVNGVFGERMCDVATRCGAEVVRVEANWGQPIDPQALLDAHTDPKVIAVVHAETSTGVRNDVACLGSAKGDALLIVDCVTSLAGIPVEIDGWGVDLAYSGTQKCLGTPPGLAPFTASERAVEHLVERPQSWYLDLNMIAKYVSGDGARAYHHTAPISMIFGLHAALGAVLEEGLENSWTRHRECGETLQAGLQSLGFELFAEEGHRLPELTTAWVPLDRLPSGMDEAGARRWLLDRFGIEVGGGLGPVAGKVWRVGCMGHTARMRNVTLLLGALEELLKS
jgi:alanine-glyoxylate transaminase / serine-glyoxylate transaminase / serine-pyruvate transaminase